MCNKTRFRASQAVSECSSLLAQKIHFCVDLTVTPWKRRLIVTRN